MFFCGVSLFLYCFSIENRNIHIENYEEYQIFLCALMQSFDRMIYLYV